MSDSEQDKSEQATPFKLSRAREKGTVARGTDLGFLTALAAFAGYAWVEGPQMRAAIARSVASALVTAPHVLDSPNAILALTGALLSSAIRPLAFMSTTVFLVVLVFEIVQMRGVVFSAEPLRLDFSRLNPATGLKRVFSLRMLIETAKNILKLGVYVTIAYVVIGDARTVDTAVITDAASLALAMARTGLRLIVLFIGAAVVFAALDQFIARRDFGKRMRMSRREVRRESRDREGEPRMKQRRKQLHREFAKSSQSLRGIKGADVLITNPIHYAVALQYDPATMDAPKVVSQGAHQFALRLKRLAFIYGVVIVQDPPLARALYQGTTLNSPVPPECYQPVADIYLRIRAKAEAKRSDLDHA